MWRGKVSVKSALLHLIVRVKGLHQDACPLTALESDKIGMAAARDDCRGAEVIGGRGGMAAARDDSCFGSSRSTQKWM